MPHILGFHVINQLRLEATPDTPRGHVEIRGGDMNMWDGHEWISVGDVNMDDLRRFVALPNNMCLGELMVDTGYYDVMSDRPIPYDRFLDSLHMMEQRLSQQAVRVERSEDRLAGELATQVHDEIAIGDISGTTATQLWVDDASTGMVSLNPDVYPVVEAGICDTPPVNDGIPEGYLVADGTGSVTARWRSAHEQIQAMTPVAATGFADSAQRLTDAMLSAQRQLETEAVTATESVSRARREDMFFSSSEGWTFQPPPLRRRLGERTYADPVIDDEPPPASLHNSMKTDSEGRPYKMIRQVRLQDGSYITESEFYELRAEQTREFLPVDQFRNWAGAPQRASMAQAVQEMDADIPF